MALPSRLAGTRISAMIHFTPLSCSWEAFELNSEVPKSKLCELLVVAHAESSASSVSRLENAVTLVDKLEERMVCFIM